MGWQGKPSCPNKFYGPRRRQLPLPGRGVGATCTFQGLTRLRMPRGWGVGSSPLGECKAGVAFEQCMAKGSSAQVGSVALRRAQHCKRPACLAGEQPSSEKSCSKIPERGLPGTYAWPETVKGRGALSFACVVKLLAVYSSAVLWLAKCARSTSLQCSTCRGSGHKPTSWVSLLGVSEGCCTNCPRLHSTDGCCLGDCSTAVPGRQRPIFGKLLLPRTKFYDP